MKSAALTKKGIRQKHKKRVRAAALRNAIERKKTGVKKDIFKFDPKEADKKNQK